MARLRGALSKSFLERNQKVIGVIGLLAIVAGTGFALLLSGGVFARTYHVTAYFTDAAGIVPGDKVTVAGLDAGTVKSLKIERGQVAVDLAVSHGVDVPADSRAQIVVETLLGKESVALVAGDAPQPLEGGSVIPASRTTTPVDITELNDISVNLLRHSDAQALNDLMTEVTKVTQGKGDQVRQLVSGLADVAQAVDSRRTQLGELLGALRRLSTTLAGRDQAIVGLIDHLNPVLSDLAQRQSEIQTLLVSTNSASHQTADLITRNRGVLDRTLAALHTDLGVIDQHQVDLAETISYLEQTVQGYSSVGYSGGTCGHSNPPCQRGAPNHWASIFVQSLGPAGVDALVGPCGLVDQMVDQVLGTNCRNAPAGPSGGSGGSNSWRGGGGGSNGGGLPFPFPIPTQPPPLPTPHLPHGGRGQGLPLPPIGAMSQSQIDLALPGSIGDFLSWTLEAS